MASNVKYSILQKYYVFCIPETCIYYIIVFSVSLLAGTIKASLFHHIAHQIHVVTINAVVNCLLLILHCTFAKLYHLALKKENITIVDRNGL